MTKRAMFLFRRDFRVINNPAFARCTKWCVENKATLCPCFIFTDKQVDPKMNPYFSGPCYAAMRSFLNDLNIALSKKLTLFYVKGGLPDTAVLDAIDIQAVFFNSDVTPFARERDNAIQKWCDDNAVFCDAGDPGDGYTVWPCGSILTRTGGTIPKSFSAFYRYARDRQLPEQHNLEPVKYGSLKVPNTFSTNTLPEPTDITIPKLEALSTFVTYGDTRDDFNICTTRMSVYLKFGVLDIRETIQKVRELKVPDLERQLIWREFYYHLAFGYPQVLESPNHHIRPDRQKVKWGDPDKKLLEKWKRGETGDVLVDQAMRSMRENGWIHNRLRMVVASYLTKDMGIDWRVGEREMATLLMDYDPAQNSGGWQSMDSQIPGQQIKASTQLKKYGELKNTCA